jgi:hypothetical protein
MVALAVQVPHLVPVGVVREAQKVLAVQAVWEIQPAQAWVAQVIMVLLRQSAALVEA